MRFRRRSIFGFHWRDPVRSQCDTQSKEALGGARIKGDCSGKGEAGTEIGVGDGSNDTGIDAGASSEARPEGEEAAKQIELFSEGVFNQGEEHRAGPLNKCFRCQPSRPPGFAKAAVLERLWKDYFKDPSQWCDLRRNKRNPKAPDFRHRATHDLLWMDNIRNPSWVASMLQKLDTQTYVRIPETQSSCTHNFKEALSFVQRASLDRIPVDKIVPVLLKCTKEKNPAFAERVHALLRKNQLDTHKLLGNYLVRMLAGVGSLQDAQSVFDRLTSRNEHFWSSLINGYIKSGLCESDGCRQRP
ncbi:hypothetical protein GOP47_0000666 [Adiantum capillus-veneris]|uniref:Uncharacterized protein n=1 Tax=Adiantum capillus-veneris TaxID=13818 RepID=A0A9D4VDY6_ADICA|nr:hypothetical protein GOP47_0000666 [Adiantum capillus-veneris]